MHIRDHAIVAAPLLLAGMPFAALGAVAPDLTWAANEVRFRRSGASDWHEWSETLTDRDVRAYRIAHSLALVAAAWAASTWLGLAWGEQFCLGWAIHVACDLPTHDGRMRQMPLYPIKWRWQWPMTLR
jgi:hypothetical protein